MRFPTPLVPARLLRRYKRFLADAVLEEDGRKVTAHCPNPGRMTGLAEPGMRIWLQDVAGGGRKLAWSWKLTELPGGHHAGIDSALANRLVAEALAAGRLEPFRHARTIRPEVRYGAASRVDFLLTDEAGRPLWLEVKNAHLSRTPGIAEFPDTVTKRGARHLFELAEKARQGEGAAVLYVVQRSYATAFRIAGDIDPAYAAAHEAAEAAGVEFHAVGTRITLEEIETADPLPILPPVLAENPAAD